MVYLKIIDPQGTTSYCQLDMADGVTNIGSHPDNDLVFNAPQIASFHAIIDHRTTPFTLIALADIQTTPQPIYYTQPITIVNYTIILLHENQIPNSPITLQFNHPSYQSQILWFWQSTTYITIRLNNPNPQTIPVCLAAIDQTATCQFALKPPASFTTDSASATYNEVAFILRPYQQITIPIEITLSLAPLIAFRKPTYPYTITVTKQPDDTISTIQAQLQQRPLIGPGLFSCLTMLIILTLMLPFWFYSSDEASQVVYQPTATVSSLPLSKPDWKVTPTSAPTATPKPISYTDIFQATGSAYNLDWRILAATAYVESRFNQYAVGRDGDTGLMQIIPSTWREWAPKVGVSNPYDPLSNVQVGAAYMNYLRSYCVSKGYPGVRWMLVAYNWGPQNINRFAQRGGRWEDLPEKQRNYALSIINATAHIQWQIPQPETID